MIFIFNANPFPRNQPILAPTQPTIKLNSAEFIGQDRLTVNRLIGTEASVRGVFSIATIIGFISLVGISSHDEIMMISHYLHLMKEQGESFTEAMIVRGSPERLVPVLMTTSTAGLSLVMFVPAANTDRANKDSMMIK